MNKGLVSNIQHFSVGDGPGIRSTVFMQGCNLKCPWCHNPETLSPKATLLFHEDLCQLCGLCTIVCKKAVHRIHNLEHLLDMSKCDFCGDCVNSCSMNALSLSGRHYTVDEVFEIIYKDYDYMKESGGGVTISGGEPLLQVDFIDSLANKCKEKGIHVILDTAGSVPFSNFKKVIPFVDTYYYDIKGDKGVYEKYVLGNFDLVLDNLKRLIDLGRDVVVRIPVIPNINDTEDVMGTVHTLLLDAGVIRVSLIPFHRLGSSKYSALGLEYGFDNVSQSREDVERVKEIFKDMEVSIS